MAERILPEISRALRPILAKHADPADPASYGLVAEGWDELAKRKPDPPAVAERLLSYRLLNDLQRQAPVAVRGETLDEIGEHASACVPVFHAALRELASGGRAEAPLDDDFARLLIAVLGEIGGPELIGDLLEIAVVPDHSTFLHVHWAISRLAQRYPDAALRAFRGAIPGADAGLRCALAEQLNLLPEMAGVIPALTSLLDGFAAVAKEEDASQLLALVASVLARRGEAEQALALLNRCKVLLAGQERRWIDTNIKKSAIAVPLLIDEKIPKMTVEDVCLSRCYMARENERDEDDPVDEGALWAAELLPPPPPPAALAPPKPGRNEPCWCGSGKKYKKCHLAADEKE
jgi:hypothetical protein